MSVALHRDALSEMYEEFRPLLEELVWSRFGRKGGDLEEMQSEARYLFVIGVQKFNPNHESCKNQTDKLRRWLRFFISRQLTETARSIRYRQAICPRTRPNEDNDLSVYATGPQDPSRMVEIMDELSADGQHVVRMVLQTPWYVFEEYGGRDALTALRNVLRELEWDRSRIEEAFSEIRAVLCG